MRLLLAASALCALAAGSPGLYPQPVKWTDLSQGTSPLVTNNVTLQSSSPSMGEGDVALFLVSGTVSKPIVDYAYGAAEVQIWEMGVAVRCVVAFLVLAGARLACVCPVTAERSQHHVDDVLPLLRHAL